MTSTAGLYKSPIFYLGLVGIIAVIVIVQVAAYFQLQNLFGVSPTQPNVAVNALINYGNGTSIWHNKTDVPSGWNFYQLTTTIAQTEAPPSASVSGQHYIVGLDGVRNMGPYYWTLWIFCRKELAWAVSPVGADLIVLRNGQSLAWYYQAPPSVNAATWSPPVTGAIKVALCSN